MATISTSTASASTSASSQDVVSSETIFKCLDTFEDEIMMGYGGKELHLEGLKMPLIRGIYQIGWENPSKIQKNAIPTILTGRDSIIQAQSGMGKTGAFAISMLQSLDENDPVISGVIILPTRELAGQVSTVVTELNKYLKFNIVNCIGGEFVDKNAITDVKRGTILIGTPGKLSDVFKKHLIREQPVDLKMIVVDEFDKTLEDNNLDCIRGIYNQFSRKYSQLVLVSATTNYRVLELSHTITRNPIEIRMKEDELTLDGIKQFYIGCENRENKIDIIKDIYNTIVVKHSIIYVNSVEACEIVASCLREDNHSVSAIHGQMEQAQRRAIMEDFRYNRTRILVSTDLTARGIDIATISLVFNFELPRSEDQYLHRIGRTGRYGKQGMAVNLVTKDEMAMFHHLEKYYSIKIEELPGDLSILEKV